jgi:adenosylmethionine-8-amino-7-oxononanoate aminotransferase
VATLPLAATLTTEAVYERFLGRRSELKTFFHGHTFTGNPLGCAAALGSLEDLSVKSGCWSSLPVEARLRWPSVLE